MIAWIKAQWAQLPHQVQGGITAFGAAIFTMMAKNAVAGTTCTTLACVKERIPVMISSGLAALFAFYMTPNRKNGNGAPPAPPVP